MKLIRLPAEAESKEALRLRRNMSTRPVKEPRIEIKTEIFEALYSLLPLSETSAKGARPSLERTAAGAFPSEDSAEEMR